MNTQLPSSPLNLSPAAAARLRESRQRMFSRMLARNNEARGLPGASRRNFLKTALLGAAGLSLPWTSRSEPASVVLLCDSAFSAVFTSIDPTGCIVTDAVINAALVKTKEGASSNESALIEVTLATVDPCSVNYLLFATGQSFAIPSVLQFGSNQRSAHLKIDELILSDTISLQAVKVSVDVTVTANNPPVAVNGETITKTIQGVGTVLLFNAIVRQNAVAVGTLFSQGSTFWPLNPTENQIPLPSTYAIIQRIKEGTVTIGP